MLRFPFWCTIDKAFSLEVYSIMGSKVLKHTAGKRREQGFTKASEKALQLGLRCCLCPGPLRTIDRLDPIVPVRGDEPSRVLWVWPERPDSASLCQVSHCTFPAPFPAEALLHPLPSGSSPSHLQNPLCHLTLHLRPNILSTFNDPFWISPFSLNHLHNPGKIIYLFIVLAVLHLNQGMWDLQSC